MDNAVVACEARYISLKRADLNWRNSNSSCFSSTINVPMTQPCNLVLAIHQVNRVASAKSKVVVKITDRSVLDLRVEICRVVRDIMGSLHRARIDGDQPSRGPPPRGQHRRPIPLLMTIALKPCGPILAI